MCNWSANQFSVSVRAIYLYDTGTTTNIEDNIPDNDS